MVGIKVHSIFNTSFFAFQTVETFRFIRPNIFHIFSTEKRFLPRHWDAQPDISTS